MTQINAKFFSEEEFDSKEKELDDLATSIDLWSGTDMSTEKEDKIRELFYDLSKNIYAIDCAFLENKLQAYKEIYRVMKEE